jgi:hypothetical protein
LLPCTIAEQTPCPPLASAPATVVYAITSVFSTACAAQMYCASGLTVVSPKPPVAPVVGVPGAEVGVAAGVGSAVDKGLVTGEGVDAPHPSDTRPATSIAIRSGATTSV